MKSEKPIDQVISELTDIFDSEDHPNSVINKGSFLIHKMDETREAVMLKLHGYFSDCAIEQGQCRVDPITFVYTAFTIEPRPSKTVIDLSRN